MRINEYSQASFVSRLTIVFALTLLLIFTALLVLENNELRKLIPHGPLRSFVILFGYSLTILTTNYLMALRGRNLIQWRTELLISTNYILFFAGATLPWLFPTALDSHPQWWQFWQDEHSIEPNSWLHALFIIQIPVFIITAKQVNAYFHSGGDEA